MYSYKDVNLWCREISAVKAKKLARSLSCKSHADCPVSVLINPQPRAHAVKLTSNGKPTILQLLDLNKSEKELTVMIGIAAFNNVFMLGI